MKRFAIFVLVLLRWSIFLFWLAHRPKRRTRTPIRILRRQQGATKERQQDEREERRTERGKEGRDDSRHFLGAEVPADWAGGGFGAGDVDCGESEEQV